MTSSSAPLAGRCTPARHRRPPGIPRTALQIRAALREAPAKAAGRSRPLHSPHLRRHLHPYPAQDRALLLVRLLPAEHRQDTRPGQCQLDGIVRAATSLSLPPCGGGRWGAAGVCRPRDSWFAPTQPSPRGGGLAGPRHPAPVGLHCRRLVRARPRITVTGLH